MKILSLLLLSGALLVQGCASAQSVNSPEQLSWESSRFVRGEVGWIYDVRFPVHFDDSMELVGVTIHQDGVTFSSAGFLASKNLDLQRGDIVDFYLLSYAEGIFMGDELEHLENIAPHKRSQAIGVVCRVVDEDCEINTSPQTTIGFGRKMRDANDYRGVTAEAKQTIYPHEIPDGFRLGGEKYTSSYVRRGISMEYEDPPKTQQQPHPDLCDASTVRERLAFASSAIIGPFAVFLSEAAQNCSGTGDHWDPQ